MEKDYLLLLPLFKNSNKNKDLNISDNFLNIKNMSEMQLSGFMLNADIIDFNSEIESVAKNTHKNFIKKLLLMRACIKKIHDKFNLDEIDYVVTKGMAIKLHGMYKNNSREFRDIDILISQESFKKAYIALRSLGFEYFNKRSNNGINFLGNMHHIPPLINKDGVIIELHHRLTLPEFFDECPLYKNALDSKIKKEGIYVVSHDILIAHAIYHGLMHDRKDSFDPVLVFDLQEILRSNNYKKVNNKLFVNEDNFIFFERIYENLKIINDETLYNSKLAKKILFLYQTYKFQHKSISLIKRIAKALNHFSYFYQVGFYSPKLYLIATLSFLKKLRF